MNEAGCRGGLNVRAPADGASANGMDAAVVGSLPPRAVARHRARANQTDFDPESPLEDICGRGRSSERALPARSRGPLTGLAPAPPPERAPERRSAAAVEKCRGTFQATEIQTRFSRPCCLSLVPTHPDLPRSKMSCGKRLRPQRLAPRICEVTAWPARPGPAWTAGRARPLGPPRPSRQPDRPRPATRPFWRSAGSLTSRNGPAPRARRGPAKRRPELRRLFRPAKALGAARDANRPGTDERTTVHRGAEHAVQWTPAGRGAGRSRSGTETSTANPGMSRGGEPIRAGSSHERTSRSRHGGNLLDRAGRPTANQPGDEREPGFRRAGGMKGRGRIRPRRKPPARPDK